MYCPLSSPYLYFSATIAVLCAISSKVSLGRVRYSPNAFCDLCIFVSCHTRVCSHYAIVSLFFLSGCLQSCIFSTTLSSHSDTRLLKRPSCSIGRKQIS